METITLLPYNEIYYKLEAPLQWMKPLRDYFSFRAPGFIFNPLYKNGLWNGYICLFKGNLFPKGLVADLIKYAETTGVLTVKFPAESQLKPISEERFNEIVKETELSDINKKTHEVIPIKLRDYQVDAIKTAIMKKHQLIVSQTSTGKTLMIYMILKILQENMLFDPEQKMLVIVPSITLVEQMYADFINYSKLNGWAAEELCTKMHSKAKPDYDKKILITTWQSLMDKDEDFFKHYQAVILDEAHKIGKSNTKESKEVEKEINKCINAEYLLGFTGTLLDEKLYRKKIQSFFGDYKEVTSYQEAISAGNICDLNVNVLKLNYTSGLEDKLRNYKNEKSFIMSSSRRNEFIKKLLLKTQGNKLLLFMEIKKHAKVIYEAIKTDDRFKGYQIILLDSSSKVSIREETKKILETNNNVIIFGTYALLGTGWSVNNIWNVFFIAPLKSKVAVLQSIGRGLRLLPGQNKVCNIWDIVDKFEYKNILYRHFLQREKYYIENKFKYKIYNFGTPQVESIF